jgi:hypothetical protein
MIVVRTPEHELFNYGECREMFDKHREVLDVDDFDTVIKTTHFFSFYEWHRAELIGCIYFYQQDDKLFVTAFAGRGHHELNLECLRMSLDWYTCDIYAENVQPTARICIRKCGFEKLNDNLYIYRRKKNGKKQVK